mgnify:CR=1 FL=1
MQSLDRRRDPRHPQRPRALRGEGPAAGGLVLAEQLPEDLHREHRWPLGIQVLDLHGRLPSPAGFHKKAQTPPPARGTRAMPPMDTEIRKPVGRSPYTGMAL